MTVEPPPLPAPAREGPETLPRRQRTWRRALAHARRQRRPIGLPIVVTVVPVSVLVAAAWLVLFLRAFPDAPYDTAALAENAPDGLRAALAILTWAAALFITVGFAAAIVAADRTLRDQPVALPTSLDPAFTRMGGLLLIGLTFYIVAIGTLLLGITIVGGILGLYVFLRIGLTLHAYILEGVSSGAAVRRSWRLLGGRVFRFALVTAVALPMLFVFIFISAVAFALVAFPFVPENPGRQATIVLNAIGLVIVGLTLVPTLTYLAAATTLAYHDARKATDG